MHEWLEIADGGLLLWLPQFLAPAEADEWLSWLLTEVTWKEEYLFGRPVPRLVAWYAAVGVRYTYSRLTHVGEGWHPRLAELTQRVSEVAQVEFNSILLNRYRNGSDSMGMHTDAEPELGINPAVATLSVGATREFRLHHRLRKEKRSYQLTHGSLLIMAGTSQHHWLHGIPKTKRPVGERISLTFRRILG